MWICFFFFFASLKLDDETDNSNCRRILLIETLLKILLSTIFSRLTRIVEEITEDHECGFQETDQLLIKCSAFVKCSKKNKGILRRQLISYS
jgi:hypothetical protein